METYLVEIVPRGVTRARGIIRHRVLAGCHAHAYTLTLGLAGLTNEDVGGAYITANPYRVGGAS